MGNPTITIVIATYNADKVLARCLTSLRAQMVSEAELIIMDGASTDSTLAIIEQYRDIVTVSHSEPDKGIYDAWNKSVSLARGDWVMFLGADDELSEGVLDRLLRLVSGFDKEVPFNYISGLSLYVDHNGSPLKAMGEAAIPAKIRHRMVAAHVASLHSRENLLREYGGFDLRFQICADYDLLLRAGEGLCPIYINEVLAKMQVGGVSFGLRGIFEAFEVRRSNKSVNFIKNFMLTVFAALAYFRFRLIHKI